MDAFDALPSTYAQRRTPGRKRGSEPGKTVGAPPSSSSLPPTHPAQVLRTKLTIGADFNTQLNIWQLRTIWEDQIIGGRYERWASRNVGRNLKVRRFDAQHARRPCRLT